MKIDSAIFPTGTRPYTSQPIIIPTVMTISPTAQYGINLDNTNVNRPTGMTFIASIVPVSFSLTRLSVGGTPSWYLLYTPKQSQQKFQM